MVTLFYIYFGGAYFSKPQALYLIIQVGIISVVLPLLFYALLKLLKKADSLMFADINQRKLPLLIQMLLLLYLIYRVVKIEYYFVLNIAFLASIVSIFLAFMLLFLNRKASLHMLGITSFTTFVILLSLATQNNFIIPISVLIFCCGAVATSRLLMKAHTPLELILGSTIGIVPQLLFAHLWV